MDPVNNPPTNSSPASGAAPSTPSAVNPLQPTQTQDIPPVAGVTPESAPPVAPVTPGAPQMPNMTEALNMVAAESAAQAPKTPTVPGVAQGANVAVGNAMSGIAGSASVNPTVPPATEPVGQEIDTVRDEVVETLSVANEDEKPVSATPIARPTNIDGINSSRMPKMPVGAMPGGVAKSNPFINTTDKQTPNVSFTDPMTEPEKNTSESVATPIAASKKKKSSKTVLIVLSVIAFLVAIALAAVLAMELMGVGPFAANNSSGQTSGQSQDSGNTNSSGNSGNSSGASSNSGTNSTNSGSTSTSTDIASGSIVCNTTITEDGVTMDSEVIFNITNNKIANVTMNAVATDAQGNHEEMSETRTFEEMVNGGEMSGYNEYMDSDGTLKVTAQEFAGYIEENLDLSGGSISCEVK